MVLCRDIPQGATLCLAVYAVYKKKKKEEKVPLAWVNQPLFDYRCQFCNGVSKTLPCWPVSPEEPLEDLLNPIGTVITNPNAADAPSISVQFKEYSQQPIIYPSMEKVLELASKEMTNYKEKRVAKTYEQELNDIVERDPLAPLYEQDKTLIWRFRMYLLENLPSSLPKLLNSVKWYQHRDVAV
uniref:PIK helical domain-containing protein n=1 Tax=Amphimedon queenslandica TaxID=400682 RepID=A0A1X7T3H7_AMPQE